MVTLRPDSGGLAEDLREVGWTDAARQSSIRTRMANAYGKSRPAGFGAKRPVAPAAPAAAKPKKGSATKATGEKTNAAGERVLSYEDGGSVTVHKDGKATYTSADGTKLVGSYKDPRPKAPRAAKPAGFTDDKDPAVVRKAQQATQKAERAAANRRRGVYPGAARLAKVSVSKARRGPIAGSTPHTTRG